MDVSQSLEQVAGVLYREGLQFDTRRDGRGYRVPFGTAAVYVEVRPWGDRILVALTAPVLHGIGDDGPGAAAALNRLNELNCRHRFLKFLFLVGDLVAAADLLGDSLHAEELVAVVYAMATAANELAAELAGETGGVTHEEWLAAREHDGGYGESRVDADEDEG